MTAVLPDRPVVIPARNRRAPRTRAPRTAGALSTRLPGRALRREYAEWSLLAVAAGAGSVMVGDPTLSAALLGVFLLAGPGLALFSLTRFPIVVVTAITPVFGMAVTAATTALLAQFTRFPVLPLLAVALAATGSAALVTIAATRDITTPPVLRRLTAVVSRLPALRAYLSGAPAAVAFAAGGVVVWRLGLPMLRGAPYSEYGLLDSPGGPVLIIAAAFAVAAFLAALRTGRLLLSFVAILLLILMLRGTVSLIAEMPVYGWTYKHIGVVEYLRTFQTLPPQADIYGQWPALFTMAAWFTSVSGIGLIPIASAFAPLIHTLVALCVIAMSRVLGFSRRAALAAAMVAELLNWVAQDYFSPQAVALILALAVLTVLLCSPRLPRAAVLGTFLFACLIPLHQLTPYWLLLVMVALAAGRRIKPWWVVAVCAALLLAFLLPRLSTVSSYGVITGLNPFANARSNVAAPGGDSKWFTSTACRALSASAFLAAAGAAITLRRRRWPVQPQIAMAAAAVTMLAGVSYGGEAIFRVFLYSIPGLAILIGPIVVALVRVQGSVMRQVVATGAATAGLLWFLTAGMQGYFGLWGQVTVSRQGYDIARSLMEQDGPVRIVPLFSGGIPVRSSPHYVDKARADKAFDASLTASATPEFFEGFPAGHLADMTEKAKHSDGAVYIALTEQDMRALVYYRYVTQAQLDQFVHQLDTDWHWHPVLVAPGVRVYEFVHRSEVLTGDDR
jgi:hypothetical protein